MAEDKPKGKRGRPPKVPMSNRAYTELVLEDMRPRIHAAVRDSVTLRPRPSMSRLYRETRLIARTAGPRMMERLVELSENSPDDRVAMMSAIAVLDRAGVMPKIFDPEEEIREIGQMPLDERKERLRRAMIRAAELLQARPVEE